MTPSSSGISLGSDKGRECCGTPCSRRSPNPSALSRANGNPRSCESDEGFVLIDIDNGSPIRGLFSRSQTSDVLQATRHLQR